MISEAIGKSDFFSIFITGCLMFYLAMRIIRQDWSSDHANKLRTILAYTFYAFGTLILVISISRIPGCETSRNKPQIEQNELPNGPSAIKDKGQPAEHKEQKAPR